MRKVWIVGANGQIGDVLLKNLDKLDFEIVGTDIDSVDVTNMKEVMDFGNVSYPDIIINCSGLTDQEECEKDIKKAYLINAIAVKNLSILSRKLNCKFVQISTDDVFDGTKKEDYTEFDEPNPFTIYGRSKLAGEEYVKEFTTKHFIIRSSWVYAKGENFVSYVLNEAKEKGEVTVANDQYATPTSADEVAKFIGYLIRTEKYGTYHATCSGKCSRYEFAKKVVDLAGINAKVNGVPMSETTYSITRPAYANLENFVMSLEHDYEFSSWEDALEKFFKKEGLNEKR